MTEHFIFEVSKPRETPVKPGTCGVCRHFKDGWLCNNKIATLGAVLQTSRDSSCNYFDAKLPDTALK